MGTMTVTSRTIVVTDLEVNSSTGFDSAIVSPLRAFELKWLAAGREQQLGQCRW